MFRTKISCSTNLIFESNLQWRVIGPLLLKIHVWTSMVYCKLEHLNLLMNFRASMKFGIMKFEKCFVIKFQNDKVTEVWKHIWVLEFHNIVSMFLTKMLSLLMTYYSPFFTHEGRYGGCKSRLSKFDISIMISAHCPM
jgi:hypothetical protein